jgi:hypothetical protein
MGRTPSAAHRSRRWSPTVKARREKRQCAHQCVASLEVSVPCVVGCTSLGHVPEVTRVSPVDLPHPAVIHRHYGPSDFFSAVVLTSPSVELRMCMVCGGHSRLPHGLVYQPMRGPPHRIESSAHCRPPPRKTAEQSGTWRQGAGLGSCSGNPVRIPAPYLHPGDDLQHRQCTDLFGSHRRKVNDDRTHREPSLDVWRPIVQ